MGLKRVATAALAAATIAGLLGGANPAAAADGESPARILEVTVQVTNLAPADGTLQTPVWVGIHDGSFDLYDRGAAISPELERLAEDGSVGPIVGSFAASGAGADSVVFGPGGAFAPGETGSVSFLIDAGQDVEQYFSYASMVIPSNDAFVANGNPTAIPVVGSGGGFVPTSFIVSGDEVLDAGSEVNDEVPANTAALAQMAPNTGVVENGVVAAHPGFMPGGNILAARPNADFTAPGYQNLRFDISAERVTSRVSSKLRGSLEVPAVSTMANGTVRLVLQDDGVLEWEMDAKRVEDVLAAHIHLAPAGSNGPVVVPLFAGDLTVGNRLRVDGSITAADLTGPMEGMTVLQLWEQILAGNAYVNLHTQQVPSGELRANLP